MSVVPPDGPKGWGSGGVTYHPARQENGTKLVRPALTADIKIKRADDFFITLLRLVGKGISPHCPPVLRVIGYKPLTGYHGEALNERAIVA